MCLWYLIMCVCKTYMKSFECERSHVENEEALLSTRVGIIWALSWEDQRWLRRLRGLITGGRVPRQLIPPPATPRPKEYYTPAQNAFAFHPQHRIVSRTLLEENADSCPMNTTDSRTALLLLLLLYLLPHLFHSCSSLAKEPHWLYYLFLGVKQLSTPCTCKHLINFFHSNI